MLVLLTGFALCVDAGKEAHLHCWLLCPEDSWESCPAGMQGEQWCMQATVQQWYSMIQTGKVSLRSCTHV